MAFMIIYRIIATTLLAALATATAVADDHIIEHAGNSYVRVGESVLMTGLGECLRTSSFGDDTIGACEGEENISEAEPVEQTVAEATDTAPAASESKGVIDTRDISELALFENNSATLSPDGIAAMQSLFDKVAEYKGITAITVTGHTSASGPAAYNQDLSERRAAEVARLLSTRYPDANMTVIGMGEKQPIATNETPEGAARNRRVEIEISASRMTFE
jgi:outer membrane protein OmpA-like peptidoglycan-associated protein